MGIVVYNVFLLLLRAGIGIASLFDDKAKKWLKGRKGVFEKLEATFNGNEKVIWVHAASLGEFEQGRPLIEQLKLQYPTYKILLTFFSPSGYEVQKNYAGADFVFYLPLDGARRARRFLEIVKPSLVIFIKYEFWYYYLKKIKYRKIPLILVSALFRENMSFFKWYGGIQRKMLSRFDHLFVQDQQSKALLEKIGLGDISSVSGDTRFDRVITIAEQFQPINAMEHFLRNRPAIIAGSTWPEDEVVIAKMYSAFNKQGMKLIIAPHEIDESHLESILKLFPNSIRYSELLKRLNEGSAIPVLIIDNIGMLSRLYRYAHTCFIGGSFRSSGVHNVLEAAVHGKPVLYGPVYTKYAEAIDLVMSGGGISISSDTDGIAVLERLIENQDEYEMRCKRSRDFILQNAGAVDRIIRSIQEKRLLTS